MLLTEVLNHRITWALAAATVTLAGSFFAFSRDILKELHFLKGQNSLLLHRFQLLDKMHEKVIGMDKDHDRLKYDLNNAFTQIRHLKGGLDNGDRDPNA